MKNVILAEPAWIPLVGIFLLLAFLAFAALVIVIGIFLFVRKSRKNQNATATPASSPLPPVTPGGTQVMPRKCPKCGADMKTGAPEGLCPACLLQHGLATEGGAPAGSAPFTPPPLEELAKLFPQLEILEVIGQGGMGAVYKARQPALERFVALKILTPRPGSDLDFSGRFTREARALARLSHPNIVAVYDFGQVQRQTSPSPEGSPAVQPAILNYFLMEYVDGPNLRQVEKAGKLSPREALQIIPQICSALQFAHDEGIVHRDIKPENVLLDKKGRVKIADFGLAKILGQEPDLRLTGARDVMGTPHYMAPEQVETPQEVDHRADIYSLGVVFYEMLTGELPLGKFDPPSHRVQIDVRLDDVVMRSLSKSPERRYQNVSEVRTRVETIAQSPSAASSNAPGFGAIPAMGDYQLNMGHCFSRGWKLVKQHFWPLIGVNALVFFLLALMGTFSLALSSHETHFGYGLSFFLAGPLLGGLYLYVLKLMRGERATMEILFSGFSLRFLHLFLGHLIAGVLVGLGFVCLILPGIYLSTAWLFTLVLIIDKGMDFWPAMELSRKVITKHWWKFFGFALLLILLKFVGVFFCVVGFFITSPFVLAAFLYAYEDIFGAATAAPSTGNKPITPPVYAGSSGTGWKIALACLGVVMIGFLVLMTLLGLFRLKSRNREIAVMQREQLARNASERAKKDLPATKTIFLTRATNQLIDASNDVRTVALWMDSGVQPGETISAMVKEGNGELHPANTSRFSNWRPEHANTSVGFSWFFGGSLGKGFGDAEADAALAQLQDHIVDKPIELTVGSPTELFSITNSSGETLAGYLQFQRTPPASDHGKKPSATVHLRRFQAYIPTSPSIDYAAKLPSGYDLRATANRGNASTFTPSGPYQYHSSWTDWSWSRRPATNGLPPSFAQNEAQRAALEAQLQDLQDQGPITVTLGKPKLFFSITNSAGEIYKGFLELVGPGGKSKLPETNSTNRNEDSNSSENFVPLPPSPPAMPPLPPPPTPLPGPPSALDIMRPAITPPPSTSLAPEPDDSISPGDQLALLLQERVKSKRQIPPALTKSPSPAVDVLTGTPMSRAPALRDQPVSLAQQPPVVVETFPASGARDVPPGETEIRVRFSKDMTGGSGSWISASETSAPENAQSTHFLPDARTCVMTVRLDPGKTYAWWLNSDKFKNFTDQTGTPALPYLLIFQTKAN